MFFLFYLFFGSGSCLRRINARFLPAIYAAGISFSLFRKSLRSRFTSFGQSERDVSAEEEKEDKSEKRLVLHGAAKKTIALFSFPTGSR